MDQAQVTPQLPPVARATIEQLLIEKYQTKVGVCEDSFNDSPEIREFQRAVDGRASKEPWCMCFMQWGAICVAKDLGLSRSPVHPSEHCVTVWNNTPEKYRLKSPKRGAWFVMKNRLGQSGHTGMCEDAGTLSFKTIEGNTNEEGSREGNAIVAKSRLVTGTASMQVLGYIDVAQMITDAINLDRFRPATPIIAALPSMHRTNVKGDWNEKIDTILYGMVPMELLSLSASRMGQFCPGWLTMTAEQRRWFFVDLLFAIAGPESGYNAKVMYWEDSMGLDSVTGLPVISEGLLQMSYQDGPRYPGIEFNFALDAPLLRKDWNNRGARQSWESMFEERSTINPVTNAKAAMCVVSQLLLSPKYRGLEFADTLGKYWSTMRRFKNGAFRSSFLAVCSTLKAKGYRI
jgi:hypothetical protein